MAGEAAPGNDNLDPQAVAPEDLKGPEDEGSLASILEKSPHPVFTGHPALGETEGGEPNPENPEGGAKEPPIEDPETPPEPPTPPEKKYKSWEDAEAGAKEHQRFATEKAEEAKRDREAREAAERERDELRQKLAEKEKLPEKPVEPPKTPEELEAEQEAKIVKALDEIGQIAEDDPDYNKKVARAWRKAGVGGPGQPAIPSGEALEDIIDQRVEERMRTQEQAREATRAQEAKAEEAARIRTRAGEMAGKAGLNMEEGTADNILFWATVNKMPKELDDKPFEEQVEWTVNEVRRLKGEVVQKKEEMAERGRKNQVNNTVLERGAERPKKPAKPEAYTLGSIMEQHQQRRRI